MRLEMGRSNLNEKAGQFRYEFGRCSATKDRGRGCAGGSGHPHGLQGANEKGVIRIFFVVLRLVASPWRSVIGRVFKVAPSNRKSSSDRLLAVLASTASLGDDCKALRLARGSLSWVADAAPTFDKQLTWVGERTTEDDEAESSDTKPISKMKKAELVALCEELGLDSSGTVAALRGRLGPAVRGRAA